MKNYKKVTAVAVTALVITGSASALATASSTKSKSNNSSSMANSRDMDDHKDGMRDDHGMGGSKSGGPRGKADRAAMETVITSTLGIDSATLRSRLAAGETLAAIAGAKKDALIAALVAEHTKRIDADLAAGRLTAEQAKTLKDNATAHVTEVINEVRTPGMGGRGHHDDDDDEGSEGHEGREGRRGHGPDRDGMGGKGLPNGSTNGIPNTSNSNN